MEKQRFLNRNGLRVDMLYAPYMMESLVTSTKISQGSWVTSRKIKTVTSHIQTSDATASKRIEYLVKRGFLKRRKMSDDDKLNRYGTKWRTDYIYSLGSVGKKYLRDWGSFTNPDGWLMRDIKGEERLEHKKVEMVLQAKEKEEKEFVETEEFGYYVK